LNSLALEFSRDVLRIIELNDSAEVVLKKEINLGFNINEVNLLKKNRKEIYYLFAEALSNVFPEEDESPLNAGILINTDQTFLSTLPVDFNEDQSNIDSHILWELSNYYPETYKNFNIKYYRLNNNLTGKNIDDILLIAVDKNRIELLNSLCIEAGIKIRNIEISHFAAEKCLPADYKDEAQNILLIGCRNLRMDFSLIRKGKLKNYDYRIIEDKNFQSSVLSHINFLKSSFDSVKKVYLYGDDYTRSISKFLNEDFEYMQTALINIDGTGDISFCPLYGLALKNSLTV